MKILQDLLLIADSGTWGDESDPSNGDAVLRSTNIVDNKLALDRDTAYRVVPPRDRDRKRLADGDILVTASSGSPEQIGKCCRFEQPADPRPYYFSNFMLRLRVDRARADPRFVYYWLISRFGRAALARTHNTTSGLRNLNKALYLAQALPLPSLSEQKRIADLLDRIDNLRRIRERSQERLERYLLAAFVSQFGEPSNGFDRAPVVSGQELFDGAGARCGPFGTALKKADYTITGVPVWQIDNVLPNHFVLGGELFISPAKYEELDAYTALPGDVLISRAGTVGRMCVADLPPDRPSIIGTNLVRLRLDKAKVVPEYFTSLCTFFGDAIRLRKGGEDAYSFMNTTALQTMPVPLPPLESQRAYVEVFRRVRRQEEKLRRSARLTAELFDSVQGQVFSGALVGA